MPHFTRLVGVDVSRRHLDVHLHPEAEAFRVDNTPEGITALLARLDPASCAIGCEATGGYESRLLLACGEAGYPVWCLHPADVRAFARLKGRRAKTDRLDARAIAEALAVAVTSRKPLDRSRTQCAIREMNTVRRRIIATIAEFRSLLASLNDEQARATLLSLLEAQADALKTLERTIRETIKADPDTARTARRIMSAPGAGPVLAAELIASMPELGSLSSRQAASLVGLAPHPRQSGNNDRPGRCQAGRANIRRVLYMATLSALRARLAPLFPFYERLRAAGKPFKLAIVAAMRKFIVMLNAMIKNNTEWNPQAPA